MQNDKECPFRSYLNHHMKVVHDFSGGDRAKQSFKDECDINVIMRRYERQGILPPMDGREPQYLDVSEYNYQDAMNTVANARALFMELPAQVRDRFKHDPAQMLEFLTDEKNRDEAVKLGLVKPPSDPPEPLQVRVVEPPKEV